MKFTQPPEGEYQKHTAPVKGVPSLDFDPYAAEV